MTEETKNKWIGVAVSLIVVGIFFGGFAIYFNSRTQLTDEQTLGTKINMEPTTNNTAANGLGITDTVVGTGEVAKAGDAVTVHYTGTFQNGTKFDSSVDRGQPFTFVLGSGQVIQGWDLGVEGMKVGGKRKLVIPSSLAYGPNDYGPIPGGSTLLFEVELLEVHR